VSFGYPQHEGAASLREDVTLPVQANDGLPPCGLGQVAQAVGDYRGEGVLSKEIHQAKMALSEMEGDERRLSSG
jgi:hypothetical protein